MPSPAAGVLRRRQCPPISSPATSFAIRLLLLLASAILAAVLLAACTPAQPSAAQPPTAAQPLIIYTWERDLPQSVLDDFTAEFGIPIEYHTYTSSEEAYRSLRQGDVYDMAAVEYRYIKPLLDEGLLRQIDRTAIPSFRYTSPEFRNLVFDPDNDYSIPYSWGSSGLVMRAGLTPNQPVTWGELWADGYKGTVIVWRDQYRDLISATLKHLGYSANSEDPTALAAVRERLLALRPNVHLVDSTNPASYVLPVLQGKVAIGIGTGEDAAAMGMLGAPMQFFYPEDGALLWGGSFVVPTASPQPEAAAAFINYLLRPVVSARITADQHFRTANAAADQFVPAELRADPVLYPPLATLQQAELLLPLSPEGERRYRAIWDEFLAADP